VLLARGVVVGNDARGGDRGIHQPHAQPARQRDERPDGQIDSPGDDHEGHPDRDDPDKRPLPKDVAPVLGLEERRRAARPLFTRGREDDQDDQREQRPQTLHNRAPGESRLRLDKRHERTG
jgi:hypothetical protein